MNTRKILNIAAFVFVVTGVSFKAMHWNGANIQILLSALLMIISLFMFGFKANKEAGVKDALNYFLVITLAIYILGAIFKIMHWPPANLIVMLCYLLALVFPIILMMQKSDFKISTQFLITFFTYFLLLICVMRHNPITQFLRNDKNTDATEQTVAPVQNDSLNQ